MSAPEQEDPPSPKAPPPIPSPEVLAQLDSPTGPRKMGDDAGVRMLLPVGRSIWAIIAGYLGLFAVLLLPAPFALLTGVLAVRDIRKSRDTPHPKHGMGRAIFGIIMGTLGSIILAMVTIAALME